MTTENELEQVKEALEYCASRDNEGTANRYVTAEQRNVAEGGLAALTAYTERLKSEDLVEEVRLAITEYNEFGSRCKTAARAAIKTIIGDK